MKQSKFIILRESTKISAIIIVIVVFLIFAAMKNIIGTIHLITVSGFRSHRSIDNLNSMDMKIKAIFKNSKKAITVIAALSLLLAFSQCKKDKEDDENFELACDASEYINNNLQSQLDLLRDKTTPKAMIAWAEWMKGLEGVASAVSFNDRVEYVYVDGTKGLIMVYNQPDEDDLDDSRWSLMPKGNKLQHGDVVGNQKCFIYDAFPYTSSNYNPGDTIQKRFKERGFECAHPRAEECTIKSDVPIRIRPN